MSFLRAQYYYRLHLEKEEREGHERTLDPERNVVVVPNEDESDITTSLREALVGGWKHVPLTA